ncbi:unnamed protein product, partial [Timema podura]|nr:unnamed protein product [Timema podura]
MRDTNKELPDNFLFETYKWALESIGRVSLDTRLGCLDPNISQHSEAHRIIASIHTFFTHVAVVELKTPFWRLISTPAWRRYIAALDVFR